MLKKLQDMLALKVSASRSVYDDPLQKYKFTMTISGMPSGAGFTKISGLSEETGVTEYNEGGYEYTHKLGGKAKFNEITAERGSFADRDMEMTFRQSLTNPNMRQTIIIEVKDKFGATKRTYKLAEAWVSKWEGSDLDAGSNDVAVEKLTIQYEYLID